MTKIISLSVLALAISMANAVPTGKGNIVQYSDPDVVDAKNLGVDVNVLSDKEHKKPGHRGGHKWGHKSSDRGDGNIVQYSDPDVIDAKNAKVGVDILKRHEGKVVQYSDPDVVDAKNIKALIDILRRNDYEVIKRSSISKRGNQDMWQFDEGDHTCYCSTKKSCGAPKSQPSQTSTPPGVHVPSPTSTPSSTPTSAHKHHHHHSSEPAKSTPTSSSHKHHHHHSSEVHTPSSTTSAHKDKPTHTPSCPAGWKHSKGGSIIQYSDPDLIDLKNLKIDISILSNNGAEEKKTVPAKNPPKCDGDYCCYKWNDESVKQISDPDLIDAKNAGINISLLSGNDGKSGLISGLLGGLGL